MSRHQPRNVNTLELDVGTCVLFRVLGCQSMVAMRPLADAG